MRNSETGEFELVLGNRQVLSGFFIVVVLFGVFFTMGYIVGRNSAPARGAQETAATAAAGTPPADARAQQPAAAAPAPVESTPAAAPPPSDSATAPAQSPAAAQAPATQAAAPAQPETQPAREAPAAAPPAESPADAGAQAEGAPAPGRYLQVSAVRREVAEVVLKTLKDKNFPALLAPGPNDRVRVLVGPYSDPAALGKAKAELENAGFQPFVQKY